MQATTKVKAVERLQRCIDRIGGLKGRGTSDPAFQKWKRDAEITIENTFGDEKGQKYAERFREVNYFPPIVSFGGGRTDFSAPFEAGLEMARAMLESMVSEIEEFWPDQESVMSAGPANSGLGPPVSPNHVFIAHGHSRLKGEVARLIESLGMTPVVLQEQPSRGRTIIEKFEEHSEVRFAVALLTPDDEGRSKGSDELNPRSRQNVVFELGYFLGKLGRSRVCALVDGEVETPSDYDGVVYIPVDENQGWKLNLARELKESGFEVDLNQLL